MRWNQSSIKYHEITFENSTLKSNSHHCIHFICKARFNGFQVSPAPGSSFRKRITLPTVLDFRSPTLLFLNFNHVTIKVKPSSMLTKECKSQSFPKRLEHSDAKNDLSLKLKVSVVYRVSPALLSNCCCFLTVRKVHYSQKIDNIALLLCRLGKVAVSLF